MRHRPGASLPVSPFVPVLRSGALALVALLAPFVTLAQVVRERVSVEAVTVTVTARDGAVDRNVELLAVGEDAQGNRTEPIRWAGTASRLDGGTFETTLDLGVPAGSFTWSLGVRDQPTGLLSFILAPSRP